MKSRGSLKSIPFDVSLRDALGNRFRVLPEECAAYAIAGVVPTSVALPRNAKEAALTLAAASAEGAIVALRGAGTKSSRPPAPRTVDVLIGTSGLSGIVEHASADLTVTVGAGTSLAQLDGALGAAGQFWPCDAPFAATATVGGTIAANASGALRLRYGALRELVLGMRMLTSGGVAVRSGSRVVKSVAGYDLHKLVAGSCGTLALVVEATLKVAPLPEVERVVVGRFASASSACAVARAIAASNLFPMAITLHDDATARKAGALLPHAASRTWMLLVRCGGGKRGVERQVTDVVKACENGGAQAVAALDPGAARRAWDDVRELAGGAHYPSDRFATFKIVSLPTDLADAIAEMRTLLPDAQMSAQPAAGILHAHLPLAASADAPPNVAQIFERSRRAGWTVSITSAPARVCASQRVATSAPNAPIRLFRAVKAAFDPNGVLDPGRMPGGV